MPLSSGLSIHDDTKHKGSAKRDTIDGVVGLSSGGSVLGLGASIVLARDGTDNINLYERTSMEIVQTWKRVGASDFTSRIMVGGSLADVQLSTMKDIANGIAGLDANGRIDEERVGGLLKTYLIGDVDLHTHNAVVSTNQLAYDKQKTITLNTLHPNPSTVRVRFQLKSDVGNCNAYGRIYKNGAPVGTERVTINTTYQTYDEDISYAQGDAIEIYAHVETGGCDYAVIADFMIRGAEHQQTFQDALTDTDAGIIDPVVCTNS